MEQTHIELSESAEANIPDGVIVPCRIRKFEHRYAVKFYHRCEHFKGLMVIREPPTWPQGYRIFCDHPIARRVSMIVED